MKICITVEETARITRELDVTEEELEAILDDESELLDELYDEVSTSKYVDLEHNYWICDEEGREIG